MGIQVGDKNIENPLEMLEVIIAFDSRDWFTDKRDFMIYAIVFGWDKESFIEKGYPEEDIVEWQNLHEKFEKMKEGGDT